MIEGKQTSEYKLAQVGIGTGIIVQVINEYLNSITIKNADSAQLIAALNKEELIPHTDVQTIESSYIGAILSIVTILTYIVKRTVLKYIELKGDIQIQLAKINAEVTAINAGAISPSKKNTQVEDPNERTDIEFV